jgi:hypothetical protein
VAFINQYIEFINSTSNESLRLHKENLRRASAMESVRIFNEFYGDVEPSVLLLQEVYCAVNLEVVPVK